MLFNFNITLAAAPPDTQTAISMTRRVAHMAFRISPSLRLQRGSIGTAMRGGYMMLSDEGYVPDSGDPSALAREVSRECSVRGFVGVILDFEHERTFPELESFVETLGQTLEREKLGFVVGSAYGRLAPKAQVLISTAIVSGSLRELLNYKKSEFGDRLVLELERIARDITLPDPDGLGERIGADRLRELSEGRQVFFSRELCSHYFTYKDASTGRTHFVMFDDAQSILKKMQLASSLGIRDGIMLFPEARDIWEDLKTSNPAVVG